MAVNAQTTRTFRSQIVTLDNGGGKTDTVKFSGSANQMLDVSGLATVNGNLTLDTTLDMNHKNLINGGNSVFNNVTANDTINITTGVLRVNGNTRIDNSGNGLFTDVTANDTINITGGVLSVNGNTRIDNSGNGSFKNLSSKGEISANVTQMLLPFYNVGTTEYMIVNRSSFPFPTLQLPSSLANPGRILVIENPIFPPASIGITPVSGDNINFVGVNVLYILNSGSAITLMSDGLGNWIKTN